MIGEREIYDILNDIFGDVFMRDDISLHPALSAEDVEGWDSFKQIEIIMAVEERFAMKFTSIELDNIERLGDLVGIVVQRGKPTL